MNLTTLRRFIVGTAIAFCVVSAAAAFWATRRIDLSAITIDATETQLSEADLSGDLIAYHAQPPVTPDRFSLRLQRSLYDAPPPKPKPKVERPKPTPTPPPPRTPKLDWTLVGTIIDSAGNVAILSDAAGKTDIRAAGEMVDLSPGGVRVRRIESQKVTLELKGQESTLRLKQSFSEATPSGVNRANRRRNR